MPQVRVDDKQPPSSAQITSDTDAHPGALLLKRDFWEKHTLVGIKEKHGSCTEWQTHRELSALNSAQIITSIYQLIVLDFWLCFHLHYGLLFGGLADWQLKLATSGWM